MNTRVHFAIHCLIAVAALAVLGYAFSQPLAHLAINEDEQYIKWSRDLYITQECLSVSLLGATSTKECSDVDSVFKPHMQAIMVIVIALMICVVLEFVSMLFSGIICHLFGLLVLGLSIGLIVLVALLSNFYSTTNYNDDKYYYKLTNTSIGVLVVASLLVLFELCCNKLIHRVVMAPYRMIAGKKA
jgi:hypothetical protein